MKSFLLSSIFLLMSMFCYSQYYAGSVVIDTTPSYNTGTASSFAEWSELMFCVDSAAKMSLLSIENYELKLYESLDSGNTWSKTSITTGEEGDIYSAMMTCTHSGQRVIIYGYNPYINYGASIGSTWNYFKYGTYAYVETPTGWGKTTLHAVTSQNTGLVPFAIYTDKNGLVHAFLHQRGWYTYGGYIHESIFDPVNQTWSSPTQIYGYSQTIDRMTQWFARVSEDPNGNLTLIYRKQTNVLGVHELTSISQVNNSWSSITPFIIDNTFEQSYWGWDIAEDTAGHFYFAYADLHGPSGPRFIMCRDGLTGDTVYPFTSSDTLRAMNFLEHESGEPVVQCYLLNVGRKLYRYDGQGNFIPLPDPIFSTPADSIAWYDYEMIQWSLPLNVNYGLRDYTFNVIKEFQGRDPGTNAVLPMPIRGTRFQPIVYSKEADLLYFSIPNMLSATIDSVNKEILVVMPVGTNFTSLTPDSILVSPLASVYPSVGMTMDFSSPVFYTVTAEDTTVKINYEVTVIDNTGIDEPENFKVKVYPNPVEDILYIESLKQINIELLSIDGKLIYRKEGTINQTIDISNYEKGVYLLRMYDDTSYSIIKIVLK